MEFNPALPKLGQTWFGTELATPTSPNSVPSGAEYQAVLLEGSVNKFKVPAMEYTNGMRLPISGRESLAILVRNTLGSALLPGQLVDWEALYRGRRVNVKTVTTATIAMAGIVDPFLPDAGVADDDLFWLFRDGAVSSMDRYLPLTPCQSVRLLVPSTTRDRLTLSATLAC